MPFEVLPILDTMLDLYRMPRSRERFNAYLNILQGNTKGDLVIPIGGYNPMAKEHIREKLLELKTMDAETLMGQALEEMNRPSAAGDPSITVPSIKVVLNLADDLMGGWTNRYTTDYDSRFKLNPLIKRNFCTPLFWASEPVNPSVIRNRTLEYCTRTLYRLHHAQPATLRDHIEQEHWVASSVNKALSEDTLSEDTLGEHALAKDAFYQQNLNSTDYSIIFNFLYGDAASTQLGYPAYGN